MRKLAPAPLFENGEILVFDKPVGLPTHSPDQGRIGFLEYAELCVGQKLWVVHRLDKETSGVLLFAKSPEAAQKWSSFFADRSVKKEYLLLSHQRPSVTNTSVRANSHIRKAGARWVNAPDLEPNSETEFEIPTANTDLIKAFPLTGKTHQIRLHAELLGMPILGDSLYGGASFSRLALHAHSLKVADQSFSAPIPAELQVAQDLKFSSEYQVALTRAQQLFNFKDYPKECFRFFSSLRLRMDKLGEVLWVYDYDQKLDNSKGRQEVIALAQALGCEHWCIQQMQDRGKDPLKMALSTSVDFPQRWLATENGVVYQFRKEQGLSPGLFVDQRENRLWVRRTSTDKKVLNLFAYTSGFSLNAALGGASEVVTVDLSKNFIAWSKENFKINDLEMPQYEFWAADSFYFLERSTKRDRRFDLIICDPPSFSRSKNGVFRIKEDLSKLLSLMKALLAPEGQILFSSNYEGWTLQEFEKELNKASRTLKSRVLPPVAPDVLVDGLSLMKAALLQTP